MKRLLISLALLLVFVGFTACRKNEEPKQAAIKLLTIFSEAVADETKYLEVVPSCLKSALKNAHDKLDIPYLKIFKAMDFNLTPLSKENLPKEENILVKQSGNFAEVTFIDNDLKRYSFVMVLEKHRYKFFFNTKLEHKLFGAYSPSLTPGVSNPPKALKNKQKGKT